MPPDRRVSGSEQIVYINNSPDTLRTLVIKLFLNIHSRARRATAGASDEFLTSGVHIRSFAVKGTDTGRGTTARYFTWQPVRLPVALAPHDRCAWRSTGITTSPSSPAARE